MFCAEGTTFLNTCFTTVVLLGRAMIQTVAAETRDRFQVNTCEFGVGWSGTGMDFSPSNSVLLSYCHPTRCQYLSSRCTLQKDSDLMEIRNIAEFFFSAVGNWNTFRNIKFSPELVFCWIHEISKFVMIKTKVAIIIQGVSKRALQLWKLIEIYAEDIHKVLNCQNVAKHTEFYLG